MSTPPVVTDVTVGIPRPMAPGVLTSPQLQDVSVYKSIRGILTQLQTTTAPGVGTASVSFGSIDTSNLASDGSPKTFLQGQIDCSIIRVAPAGSSLGVENVWVGGGGTTAVVHHLGRTPIGWICIRNTLAALIADAPGVPADATHYTFLTTHSDSDTYIIFI